MFDAGAFDAASGQRGGHVLTLSERLAGDCEVIELGDDEASGKNA